MELTSKQLELLEAIKAEKEKLSNLPPWDPKTGTWVPEFYEIQKKINDLSVKALRSGLLRSFPTESRHPGFHLVFDSHGESAKVLPRFGDFHPDLPPWAENHFVEWIQMLRIRRHDARDILRETGIISIETGIKSPVDVGNIEFWELIKHRVLELRGVGEEKARTEKGKKRTRKNFATWGMVIDKLVEQKLLSRGITPQAFKKSLKKHFPNYPWDKV